MLPFLPFRMGIFTLCHCGGSIQYGFDLCRDLQLREYLDSRRVSLVLVITVEDIKNFLNITLSSIELLLVRHLVTTIGKIINTTRISQCLSFCSFLSGYFLEFCFRIALLALLVYLQPVVYIFGNIIHWVYDNMSFGTNRPLYNFCCFFF